MSTMNMKHQFHFMKCTWLLFSVFRAAILTACLVLELDVRSVALPVLAAVIRRMGWEQVLPSAHVESGQPHSSCLVSAAALARRCFSINWVTMASTVSAVCTTTNQQYRPIIYFVCNPILFAICTSTFSKLCKKTYTVACRRVLSSAPL
jgi:hypothetical protein